MAHTDWTEDMNSVKEWLFKAAIRRFLKGPQMQAILDFLGGKKTYTAGIVMVLIGLAGMAGVVVPGIPEMDHAASIRMILEGLAIIFLRQGVAKAQEKAGTVATNVDHMKDKVASIEAKVDDVKAKVSPDT